MSENVTVVRGPDWKWGDQDGGVGSTGTALKVLKSSTKVASKERPGKTAFVKWSNGSINLYRIGAENAYDLRILDNSGAGVKHTTVQCDSCSESGLKGLCWECTQCDDYYLCSKCYMSDKHILTHEFFRIDLPDGNKVRVSKRKGSRKINVKKSSGIDLSSIDSLMELLLRAASDSVEVSCYYEDHLPVFMLPKFDVGDTVMIERNTDKMKSLQDGHGGWVDNMAKSSGKIGKIVKVFSDGDLKVLVDGDVWTYNPNCVVKVEDAELEMLAMGAVLSEILGVSEKAEGFEGLMQKIVQNIFDQDSDDDDQKSCSASSSSSNVTAKLTEINDPTEDGNNALHLAVSSNNLEDAEKLIKQGADVNKVNKQKCSPLHLAVNSGSTDCVRLLLKHNCDVNIQDNVKNTALHYAIRKDNSEVIGLLVSCPRTNFRLQNNIGYNVLQYAVSIGNAFAVEKIVSEAQHIVDTTNENGDTSLHESIKSENYEITKLLLRKGRCKINVQNKSGETPLLIASKMARCPEVELLVFLNANVNAEDKNGNTGLHLSLLNQHYKYFMSLEDSPAMSRILSDIGEVSGVEANHGLAIACFLASKGGDIYHRNRLGKTPLDFVETITIQKLLLKFAGKSSHADSRHSSSGGRQVPHSVEVHSKCMVCDESTPLIRFEPCNHSVVCRPCSLRMKTCIFCRFQITRKIEPRRGSRSDSNSPCCIS